MFSLKNCVLLYSHKQVCGVGEKIIGKSKSIVSLTFQNVELPETFTQELRGLLEGLLHRDVDKRLGCKGRG